jgi:hypothetical protein
MPFAMIERKRPPRRDPPPQNRARATSPWPIALALASLLANTACTHHDGDGTTQVAARVNGGEITVHQVNFLLENPEALAGDEGLEAGASSPKRALDHLIDEEMLVQAAKARELDRQPEVLAATEAARRKVLARAFLDQVDASVPPPEAADIHAYYVANPALFSERRVYTLREIRVGTKDPADSASAGTGPGRAVAPAGADASGLQAIWERTHRWDALLAAARAADTRLESGTRVLAAEQLPLEAVPAFQRLNEGDVRITQLPEASLAQQVVHIEREPMSEAAAAPSIAAYLLAQRRHAAEIAALAGLKQAARVERVGEFAAAEPGAPAPKPAQ